MKHVKTISAFFKRYFKFFFFSAFIALVRLPFLDLAKAPLLLNEPCVLLAILTDDRPAVFLPMCKPLERSAQSYLQALICNGALLYKI